MKRSPHAVHQAIVVVDVERFTHLDRNNADLLEVRRARYDALKDAITGAGIDWNACTTNGRGDGALVLVPPDVTKDLLVTSLGLEVAFRRHNTYCSFETRTRLRVAAHAGEIYYDDHGVTDPPVRRRYSRAKARAHRAGGLWPSGCLRGRRHRG